MKVLAAASTLIVAVGAFSGPVSKPRSTILTPSALSMLPQKQKQQQQQGAFFPFEEADTKTKTKTSTTALNANKEAEDGTGGLRQLLGVRGATQETNIWKIRLQLTKPVTWIPLLWGVMCGAAASGNYHWIWNPFDPNDRDVLLGLEDAAKGLTAMILAGPFLTGYTQTINDWYDRDIDAINEPNRPIPSGAIKEDQVIAQIWILLLGGLGLSYGLDVWAGHDFPINLVLAIFGSFISYIYSAPPLKLKQNGWAGNYALGASYISLPWWCGQAVFGELDRPVFWIL
jgi:chlorophyll synthase